VTNTQKWSFGLVSHTHNRFRSIFGNRSLLRGPPPRFPRQWAIPDLAETGRNCLCLSSRCFAWITGLAGRPALPARQRRRGTPDHERTPSRGLPLPPGAFCAAPVCRPADPLWTHCRRSPHPREAFGVSRPSGQGSPGAGARSCPPLLPSNTNAPATRSTLCSWY